MHTVEQVYMVSHYAGAQSCIVVVLQGQGYGQSDAGLA